LNGDEAYAEALEIARTDPNVVGFFASGSRGKSAATMASDHDCCMVVFDAVVSGYKERYTNWHGLDLSVFGLSEFAQHAAIDTKLEWDRYNFAHLTVSVDKLGGVIQRLVDEKGSLPEAAARARLGYLDGYINSAYRSLKNARDGRQLAALLDAVESIAPLLTWIFAVHLRLRPYNKYLRWELEHWPLADLPWGTDEFLDLLGGTAAGDLVAQKAMFAGVRTMAVRRGLEGVLAVWGDKLAIFAPP